MSMAGPKPIDPNAPKAKGMWGTILTMTPVVLTIVATVCAGMSSSEMTQSMYYRSLAAQNQSKAGDQWSLFQAKRIRGTNLETAVDLLQNLGHPDTFEPARLGAVAQTIGQTLEQGGNSEAAAKYAKTREKIAKLLTDENAKTALAILAGGDLPKADGPSLSDKATQQSIADIIKAIDQRQTDAEIGELVHRLHREEIEEATRMAEKALDSFDSLCKPINEVVRQTATLIKELGGAVRPFRKSRSEEAGDEVAAARLPALFDELFASFKAASLDYDARRYRKEAQYNQAIAQHYEIQVRHSGAESDRHRRRSRHFFYSMLTAQAGVTIASLALATAQRSALWYFAAVAGAAAIMFSGYVYFSF
jgi:hypothetical protein